MPDWLSLSFLFVIWILLLTPQQHQHPVNGAELVGRDKILDAYFAKSIGSHCVCACVCVYVCQRERVGGSESERSGVTE